MEAIQRELIEREDTLRHENEELKSQVHNLTQTLQQLEQVINPQDFSSNQSTCVDIQQHNSMSGVHKLYEGNVSVSVYCDQDTDGGGWTVFQRRYEGSVNFFLNWTEYTRGFGDLNGEFWLGLDNLHILTSSRRHELRVDLQAFNGTRGFASYSGFIIGNSSTNYKLDFDDFLGGNAGDSLTYHKGHEFLTPDRDSEYKCASGRHGAWWYDNCFYSNLNGIYRPTATTPHADGIIWLSFAGYDNSLKRTEMKIRPM
ncbi:ficolin-2-like [Pomacea canaliculata]|uniref:ficolin-2-like n=1 Tax=Pomacea canaliculata TaxID=400727 RepID=UPI000D73B063|nr:ficolin-2-like [Pomacea canaliculata]